MNERPGATISERAGAILAGIADAEIGAVAAAILDAHEAMLPGAPVVEGIVSAGWDPRTIAIVRFSGTARVAGAARPWSTIAKLFDFDASEGAAGWVRPQNEEWVYATGHFAHSSLKFRPARCYHISRPSPAVRILWLEDLSELRYAPFTATELAPMLEHLGEWNGFYLRHPPDLNFPPGRDSVFARWDEWKLDEELADFRTMADSIAVLTMYRDLPIEMAFELADLLLRLKDRAGTHTHSLCFGDCNIGNLFSAPAETIAVDWAGVTSDPLGVDAGAIVGSAITWGRDVAQTARDERELFEHYYQGLMQAGWTGDRDEIRGSYLVHFGFYLLSMAIMPAALKKNRREGVERRMKASWDEMPELVAGIIDLLPSYLNELRRLLD